MKKLDVFIPILLTIILALSIIPRVNATPIELYYDDGSPETSWSASSGLEHAVRFSLKSSSSAQILTARYFIQANPSTFRVHIYDNGGTTNLITPFDVTPGGTGWFDVDLTTMNIVVTGDFFIAIEYLSSGQPPIGVDTSSPINLRTYSREPGQSWEVANNFNLMIRAVVEEIGNPVGGVFYSADKVSLLSPYIALVGLIGAISTIFAIRRWRKD